MSKYLLDQTNSFKKDLKHAKKCGYKMELLHEIIDKLQDGETLPSNNRDHALTGNWRGFRECHYSARLAFDLQILGYRACFVPHPNRKSQLS